MSQLSGITVACEDVEFVFLEPPIVVNKIDVPWHQYNSDSPSGSTTDDEVEPAELAARAWWLTNNDTQVYTGLEDSLRYIHEFLSNEPRFDVSWSKVFAEGSVGRNPG